MCVVEGPDLVRAALDAGQEFEGVFVDASHVNDAEIAALMLFAHARGVRSYLLAPGVLERIADAQSPQPVLAAVRFLPPSLESLSPRGVVVVMHDVRDPGNAGTVVRTADAAGASAVIVSGDSVDPYNPKTLRATAGSIFHVPVAVVRDLREVTRWFHEGGGRCFATVVTGGTSFHQASLLGSVMVVIGNEGDGLDDATVALCDERLTIPMVGRNESLNLSMAAGLILFEALRQRAQASGDTAPPIIGAS